MHNSKKIAAVFLIALGALGFITTFQVMPLPVSAHELDAEIHAAETKDISTVFPVTTPQPAMPFPPELNLPEAYYRAKVLSIPSEKQVPVFGTTQTQPQQELILQIENGPQKGKAITINYGENISLRDDQKFQPGEVAIIAKSTNADGDAVYTIFDHYRLPPIYLIIFLFFGLVILLGRMRGFTSIIGLCASILILIKGIIPAIIAGMNPLLVSIIGSLFIMVIALYLAHGFNIKTSIALTSTFITLCLSALLSIIFVELTHLTGLGSEDVFYLQSGPFENLNLKGLLLGGIIIGALGVLDDITTSQTAAIQEIKNANPRLTFKELYKSGFTVGREHIASLVNTLVLAYAGASLPLFLIFSTSSNVPLWLNINSEPIVEEIVRTLVGSTSLVLAVPISTFLAAYIFTKNDHA